MEAHSPDNPVKFFSSRRGLAAIAALLLVLFLFRPGIHQLRDRIARSIGSALGRRVTIDDVRIHILPRPGFDLEGIVIYDEPAFGAEPMIRAQDVFAAIRLRSLLRGRLEIARLSATDPSINVVRSNEGRWNIASLIERNAQIPAAPTQKSASERRPGFPYLEATGARINFKIGAEKKSYALSDADVSLWQDSENSWGARMKAEPVRTDFNLTDTGRLLVDATWQRSRNLGMTPLRFSVAWENGQLGQITQLLSGRDRGFRGAVSFTASLSGTPHDLAIVSSMSVRGFRRYDIVDNRTVNLTTDCTANYSVATKSLRQILCESPVGDGRLQLRGSATTAFIANSGTAAKGFLDAGSSDPPYDLTLSAKKISLASALALLHQAKQQLPPDLTARGTIEGEFRALREGDAAQFSGTGAATDVRLISNSGKDSITLGNVPLTLAANADANRRDKSARAIGKGGKGSETDPSGPHFLIGPASLEVDGSSPAAAGGWVSASAYRFFLRGDLELKNLFRLETAFGLPSVRPAAEGAVKLDVSLQGNWQGLAAPNALGTALLRNVRAETHGVNTPIIISSASAVLAPDTFSMQKIVAQMGDSHWTGSLSAPRHCAPACSYQFDLSVDRLSSEALVRWFIPQPAKQPWYRILNSGDAQGPSPLLALRARGNLRVGRFELKKFAATQVAAQLTVERGKISIGDLRANALQGTHRGNWSVDASVSPPRYRGSGTWQNVSLAQVGALMNDPWITGNADGSFDVESTGTNLDELLAHADGKLQFLMRNGSLPHVQMPGVSGPLLVHRFTGTLQTDKDTWRVPDGRLESRDGLYLVRGSAGPDGLDFILQRSDRQSWNLRGALAKPHVTPASEVVSRKEADAPKDTKQ